MAPFEPFTGGNGANGTQQQERSGSFIRLAAHRPVVMSDASLDSANGHLDADSTDTSPAVTPDDAFRALADPQRRAVLSYLHERPDETVTVETLAGALVREESESDQRHLAAALATVHLPTLDTCGVVDYDREHRTVRYIDSPLVSGLLARLNTQ